MPEPQRTDGGGAEGEYSVSSVSLELMAKDGAGGRIQCIIFMHSTPEDFINEDIPKASYGPSIWAPINHPRPSLQYWGRSDSMVLDSLNGPRP
ncbi:hypothetical protein O181_088200 [Austropuccinia psidii MF-1]|uniref:Uncharacterized protein n=1 Tax=Austropuccinia psidii MF-1 TaxID=1389203 RepID=A0A9Q3IRC6_9BASI|nr:hypothetical protein [Austropuccinia psidii MF-1]